MTTAALIVSAGTTPRREGFDPMAQVGSLSALQRLVMTFRLAGVEPVAVVIPEEERKELESHAARLGLLFLHSQDPGAEMFDSVRMGLTRLLPDCDRVLVTPVDLPLVSVETLKTLMGSGHKLAVPAYRGSRGHPLLVDREVIPALLDYRGEGGLRGAAAHSGYPLAEIPVEDPGVLLRSPQPGEHREILEGHALARLRPVLRLQLAKESVFLGPGSRQLLGMIQSTGSVRLASQQMGISYSKAWKILNHLEEQLGYPVVSRKKGGRHGGETALTGRGEELLRRFDAFVADCNAAVTEQFHRHFSAEEGTSHETD